MTVQLIATCPHLYDEKKVEEVFSCPEVYQVRYNTGCQSLLSVQETVETLYSLSEKYQKPVWIDIKGRQLRITKWADPLYEAIELNHSIELVYPAKILLRNNTLAYHIKHVRNGNQIILYEAPQGCVGAGQSVNIIAKELIINGYLTDTDKKYLEWCRKTGMINIMASFVEKTSDLSDIRAILPEAHIVSKIESINGLSLISRESLGVLMAARDDLQKETINPESMLNALRLIINKDTNAICASKIFTSLEKNFAVEWSDFADIIYMYGLGYRRFMLCDNVSNFAFARAIEAWKQVIVCLK